MKTAINAQHHITGVPYSSAVMAGGLCFISGQFGTDKDNHPVGDVGQQTTIALDHLEEVLQRADLSLEDVVRITVWLRDLDDFDAMNRAYRERFRAPQPARVTVQAAGLLFGAAVEIDAIAAS